MIEQKGGGGGLSVRILERGRREEGANEGDITKAKMGQSRGEK